ncbi:MAG: hypothetical protein ACK5XX_05320 [Holosporales bacterium]|jgi:hypothetical protein
MTGRDFESDEEAYAWYKSWAWRKMEALPGMPEPLWPRGVIHDHKVGDTFSYGEEVHPTWWRRVFLREKPRTVLKTAVITAIAKTGTIICDAPPVQLTRPSWWRRVFLRENARVVFAEPPKKGAKIIIVRRSIPPGESWNKLHTEIEYPSSTITEKEIK